MNWIISFLIGLVAFFSCHLGLGLGVVLSLVIAVVCMILGVVFVVFVLDGDGTPW